MSYFLFLVWFLISTTLLEVVFIANFFSDMLWLSYVSCAFLYLFFYFFIFIIFFIMVLFISVFLFLLWYLLFVFFIFLCFALSLIQFFVFLLLDYFFCTLFIPLIVFYSTTLHRSCEVLERCRILSPPFFSMCTTPCAHRYPSLIKRTSLILYSYNIVSYT